MKSSISVIIPAAGTGVRFRENAPKDFESKLFAKLQGKPLIAYTLECFEKVSCVREIIIATSKDLAPKFKREILPGFKMPIKVVRGGKTRAESVFNALSHVSKNADYVCIHDGARPLIQASWVNQMIRQLKDWDGIVLGRQAVPTIKVFGSTGEIKKTLNRAELFEAETPQIVKKEVLTRAYKQLGPSAFGATDDVSLVERLGGRVKTFLHSGVNLKITTYQDLELARALMEKKSSTLPVRIGSGWDLHRLEPNRNFYLGSVLVTKAFGPVGHSDGDPLLHAITDAILGAMGAGDIGDFFSDQDKRWKNMKSSYFVKKAILLAKKKGFVPVQVDTTVILEKPKLSKYKEKIKKEISKIMNVPVNQIGLKAKTAEGLGAEGNGKAVSAQALVLLKEVA